MRRTTHLGRGALKMQPTKKAPNQRWGLFSFCLSHISIEALRYSTNNFLLVVAVAVSSLTT
jgi:hypothetical protein